MEFYHRSVLLEECIQGLNIDPDGVYVDGTAGGGGHSVEIARQLTGGRLIAIDKDKAAIAAASKVLAPYPQAQVVRGDFRDMEEILDRLEIHKVNGILLDLGVSSYQLDAAERGFSYHNDAPLDMRMSGEGISAKDIVNSYDAEQLARIFWNFGEERYARRIASGIVRARQSGEIATTGQLAELIKENIPAAARREGGHPAKRVFQAVRIAVNGELDSLEQCLETAFALLAPKGRFAVITFHSLEDRMVKRAFGAYCSGCTCPPDFPVCVCGKSPRARLVNRKPITAGDGELAENNRSRSAKLRILEKSGIS